MQINAAEFHSRAGVAELIQFFNKAGLTVAKVNGDPNPKRENGILTKCSTILFQSGQKLEMRLNLNGGNIYQWRLNGKVLAVKNYHQLDQAMKEIVEVVRVNERGYKTRQAAANLRKERVVIPKLPTATMTLQEQIEEQKKHLAELQAEGNIIRQHIAAQESVNAEKRGQLTLLGRQIAGENERTKMLEERLANAKHGIFESVKTAGCIDSTVMLTESASFDPITAIRAAKSFRGIENAFRRWLFRFV